MGEKSRAKFWQDDGKGHRSHCDDKNKCPALRMAVQGETTGRGFGTAVILNFGAKPITSKTIILYRKAKGDDGIVLNHCPFCGKKINVSVKKPAKKGTKA